MPSCAWCSMCSGLPQLKVPSFSLPWVSFQGGTMPSRSRFTLLSRFALRVGLVTLRQTFVHCSQNCVTWSAVTTRGRRPARLGQLGLASSAVSESGGDAPLRPKADDPQEADAARRALPRGYFHQGC